MVGTNDSMTPEAVSANSRILFLTIRKLAQDKVLTGFNAGMEIGMRGNS